MAERNTCPRVLSGNWMDSLSSAGQDITFRPACLEDEPFLRLLYAGTREDELALLDWDQPAKDAFVAMQFHAQHTFYHDQYPDADYLILLHGGQPVGRLYLERFDREIRIIDIAILPGHRNRGIGTAVLLALQREASRHRMPLAIHVEKFNRALRWYLRLGFIAQQDSGVYLLMKWAPENAKE